jgi:putative transposase
MNPALKPPADLPADTVLRTVATTGTITLNSVQYRVGPRRALQQVLVITYADQPRDKIIIADLHGEVLAEHTRPAPGIGYVGTDRRPGHRPPQAAEPSPKS